MPIFKNHTKFKIIKWVERLLKYKPEPIRPMSEKQRTIQTLKWEKIIREEDFYNGSYRAAMTLAFAEKLRDINVIEVRIMDKMDFASYPGKPYREVRIQGRLFYVTPEKN